jgi:hypothetical protein
MAVSAGQPYRLAQAYARLCRGADGKATVPAPLRAGVSYARQTGVEHDVINDNDFEFVFVEIEVKSGA